MRRIAAAFVVVGVVLVATAVRAAEFLLEPVSRTDPASSHAIPTLGFTGVGGHSVGLGSIEIDQGMDALVWYPAVEGAGGAEYTYGIGLLGGTVSIGSAAGSATSDAEWDRRGAPYPVVVLSPGFAMAPSTYGWLGEHLASHGLTVVAPDHGERLDPAGLGVAAVTRPPQVSRVIDAVEDLSTARGPLAGLVDAERVAVVGHSVGGATALASAGARFDLDGVAARCEGVSAGEEGSFLCDAIVPRVEEIAAAAGFAAPPVGTWRGEADPRVDAVVSMAGDAYLFGAGGLGHVGVPMLAIGGLADADSPFSWTSQLAFDEVGSARRAVLALDGAGHMVFTNECLTVRRAVPLLMGEFCDDEGWARSDAHRVIGHAIAGFLTAELGADRRAASAMADGLDGVPGVTWESVGWESANMELDREERGA
jgi:predicted dienelactone hydrolase